MSFLVSLLYHRSEEEGSEETMDTESQQRSTLSNEVYKQVHVLKSARKQVFCKLPIVDIAISATWQFFYGCERSNAFNKKSVIFALKSFFGNTFLIVVHWTCRFNKQTLWNMLTYEQRHLLNMLMYSKYLI